MQTAFEQIAKISIEKGVSFRPFKHAYTIYRVGDSANKVYVESDSEGEDLSLVYILDYDYEILDTEGSACFSDSFDSLLIEFIKGL